MTELLTHSRQAAMGRCLRESYYRYELGLEVEKKSDALRIGTMVHKALETLSDGCDAAVAVLAENYAKTPPWVADNDELLTKWEVEYVTVCQLVLGYTWHWEKQPWTVVAAELPFQLMIRKANGKALRGYRNAGKLDKIIRHGDGLALAEHKTTADSIAPDSDYWGMVRVDDQVSRYMLAARDLGYDVRTIIWDVIKKPGIRPKVVNGDRETPDQFGKRLSADIRKRPEFYYARMEMSRTETELKRFREQLAADVEHHRWLKRTGYWRPNAQACTRIGTCRYLPICPGEFRKADDAPAGYVWLDNKHPELNP